jgi:hypothetical protein
VVLRVPAHEKLHRRISQRKKAKIRKKRSEKSFGEKRSENSWILAFCAALIGEIFCEREKIAKAGEFFVLTIY